MPDDDAYEGTTCRLARENYEVAKDAAAAAFAAEQEAKDDRNAAAAGCGVTGAVAGVDAGILGAGSAGGSWTGWGLVIGLGFVAIGLAVIAVKKHFDAKELKKICHHQYKNWLAAKANLMKVCPHSSWPDFPIINC
jgi:hypothetical protein